MTGRELIIYILQNNLEDEAVFEDGKLLGHMTVPETAAKFNVGTATINLWVKVGYIRHVKINDVIYIPANTQKPNTKINCEVLVL